MDAELDCLVPDWPSPPRVRALVTTRKAMAGASQGPFARFNLGTHVGDDPGRVRDNRARLRAALPREPRWMNQVHGVKVLDADCPNADPLPEADAAVTREPRTVLAIMTADCLPILLCDRKGEVVAVAHAGWRGLAAGVIENALDSMRVSAANVMAWLGPAIGPDAYEVGTDVVDAFVGADAGAAESFRAGSAGKYLADLYGLARRRLSRAGVGSVTGGGFCTYRDADRFYSYRRDGRTGRMASLVWIEESAR